MKLIFCLGVVFLNVACGGIAQQKSEKADKWRFASEVSPMDQKETLRVCTDAENDIEGHWRATRPILCLQAEGGKIDVIVRVGIAAQPEYGSINRATVRIRFDNGKPITQRWLESTDNEAFFAPNPTELINQLTKAKTFLFEFTPFRKAETVATFDLTGINEQIGRVRKTQK